MAAAFASISCYLQSRTAPYTANKSHTHTQRVLCVGRTGAMCAKLDLMCSVQRKRLHSILWCTWRRSSRGVVWNYCVFMMFSVFTVAISSAHMDGLHIIRHYNPNSSHTRVDLAPCLFHCRWPFSLLILTRHGVSFVRLRLYGIAAYCGSCAWRTVNANMK